MKARHEISPLTSAHAALPHNTDVRFFAANPAQDLTARFMDGAVRVESGKAGRDWQAHFRFHSISGRSVEPGSLPDRQEHNRIEYDHGDGVTEWWVNQPEGLEHGFTLEQRPARSEPGEFIHLRVAVEGGLRVEPDPARPGDLQIVEEDHGDPLLSYRTLKVWDAQGKVLPAEMQPGAGGREILLVVNDAAAAYPLTIDPLVVSLEQRLQGDFPESGADGLGAAIHLEEETALIVAPGTGTPLGESSNKIYEFVYDAALDRWMHVGSMEPVTRDWREETFGEQVVLDGNTVLVSDSLYHGEAGQWSGCVYVFVKDPATGVWSQQAQLFADNAGAGDNFGTAIALEGDIALIGAPAEDDGGTNVGSVYVFERESQTGNWSQHSQIYPEDADLDGAFGCAISLQGDRVLIGAEKTDLPSQGSYHGAWVGCVFAYERDPDSGIWTQQDQFFAENTNRFGRFGCAISLDGERALIGSKSAGNAGRAYIFERDALTSEWGQQAIFNDGASSAGDQFGYSVVLQGDTAVVGIPYDDVQWGYKNYQNIEVENAGSVSVFVRDPVTDTWSRKSWLRANDSAESGRFGLEISMDGNRMMVSHGHEKCVYVYERQTDSGEWQPQGKVEVEVENQSPFFGSAVSLDGDRLLICAVGDDTAAAPNSGSAYIFERNSLGSFLFQTKFVSSDGAGGSSFGASASLDGDMALVGAPGDDSDTGGDNAGSAYIFAREPLTGTWVQQAKLRGMDTMAMDLFGRAVSLEQGTALIGAPYDHTIAGGNAGSAYVFTRQGGIWTQQAKLQPAAGQAESLFGSSVSLSGDWALVGAPLTRQSLDIQSVGSAFLFSRNPDQGSWSESATWEASDAAAYDFFGGSVSLQGSTAIVGAYGAGSGAAYAFAQDPESGLWAEEDVLSLEDGQSGDWFGWSVSLDGNTALIGSPRRDTELAHDVGAAYVFRRDPGTGSWTLQNTLEASNGAVADRFGSYLSLNDQTAVVGVTYYDAPLETGNFLDYAGMVYVYTLAENAATVWDFGPVAVGQQSPPFLLFVRNTSATSLTGISATLEGDNPGDFLLISPPQGEVAPGESTSLEMSFSPSSLGARHATLRIISDQSPDYLVTLQGVGGGGQLQVEDAQHALLSGSPIILDFGSVYLQAQNTRHLIFRNIGESPLHQLDFQFDAPDYQVSPATLPPSLAPGESFELEIRLIPTEPGSLPGALELHTTDSTRTPLIVNLKGRGVQGLEGFRQYYFHSPTNIGNAANLADWDGDGFLNVVEHASGSDPTATSSIPVRNTQYVTTGGETYLSMWIDKPAGIDPKIRFLGQVSANLSDWDTGYTHISVLEDTPERYHFRDRTPLSEGMPRFLRVEFNFPTDAPD